ncbi:galanin receptor 2b-like [Branchiostoma floridae]|uniref:Galanin receptor 2b-like n=1 Tax=Branchiostoma floridae TaxID=7739 RepID=A0A9J7KP51_BRAFL|nr:galanin receptor 2b-like [Branchiostoma floridae]
MENPQDVNFTTLDLDPNSMYTNTTFALAVPESHNTPLVVVLSLIALLGFVGNTVMLIAMLMGYKRGWSNTDLFILNVIVIDLVVVSINAPLRAVVESSPWFPLGESGCKAAVYFPYFGSVAVPMAVLSLVLNAAFQRVFRAPYPLWLVCAALVFVWVVALHVPIPAVVYSEVISYLFIEDVKFICHTAWPSQHFVYAYDTGIFALFYALPTLMLLAFCIVMIAVRRNGAGPVVSSQEGRRTDILIIIMAALFVVMYLPYYVTFLYLTFGSGHDTRAVITMKAGICLIYLNSAVKPLLCACLYGRFRRAFSSGYGRDERAGGTEERETELGSL